MSQAKFLATEKKVVFTFGNPPSSIDIMTTVKGLTFNESYDNSSIFDLQDISIRVLSRKDLIAAKQATGRYRDLADVEQLQKGEEE